ncbi:MAG: hypothetical protein ACI9DC_005212 [Gammaproteobacteria bacterium]|jgi:hypothetical protein
MSSLEIVLVINRCATPTQNTLLDQDALNGELQMCIEHLCQLQGISLSVAALQLPLAHPAVATVIPGANSADQVCSNVDAFRADIPAAFCYALREENLNDCEAPVPSLAGCVSDRVVESRSVISLGGTGVCIPWCGSSRECAVGFRCASGCR